MNKFDIANKQVTKALQEAIKEQIKGFQVPCRIIWGIDEKDNKIYDNETTTAEVLKHHTYGVVGKLPMRDCVFDPVIASVDTISSWFTKAFRHSKDDEWKLLKACKAVSRLIAENICKATIMSNGAGEWADIKESTKKHKRNKANSNAILRDEELMFDAIKGYADCPTLGKKL